MQSEEASVNQLCRLAMLLLISGACAGDALGQVTFDRLLHSGREPQNWMTYSGDNGGHRFSGLDQVKTSNAGSLVAKWVYQTAATGKFETTPLVVDGILYATGQDDRAFALDARTGRPIWLYQRQLPTDIRPCCGRVNRGVAIWGDKVFLGTLDAHVVALDAKTGNVIWDVAAVDYRKGYSFTAAPLALNGLVILGVSGGEYGIRGFIDAYDATTGQRKWRFSTIPGPGEPGHDTWEGESWKIGGAPAWMTGVYDAAFNQLLWTTGNPSPSNRGAGRAGDNLYSNSLLSLDPVTGRLKWYFQFTKHDEHDWDATQVPVILDFGGKHLVAQANRNGFFMFWIAPPANWSRLMPSPGSPAVTRKMGKDVRSPIKKARQLRKGEPYALVHWALPTGCHRVLTRGQNSSTSRRVSSATFSARPHNRTSQATPITAARIFPLTRPSPMGVRYGLSIPQMAG